MTQFKEEDYCPSCKSKLSVIRIDKNRIERKCPTCRAVVVDTIKEKNTFNQFEGMKELILDDFGERVVK